MLTLYWICLAVGGVFVLLALLGGLEGLDLDEDLDAEPDLDTDLELADPGDRTLVKTHRLLRSLFGILTSLKFWSFGACFFGLTGVVLSRGTVALSPLIIAIAAVIVGTLCGALVAGILRVLRQRQVDSLVHTNDLVGLIGAVEVPFDLNSRGKVRLSVKGSVVDFIAYTDEPGAFNPGDLVLVVGLEENRLWVVSADRATHLLDPPQMTQ